MRTMTSEVHIFTGSVIIMLWGIAHIYPVRNVVAGSGPVSVDNRRIITMEWVAEGLALFFIGILTSIVTGAGGLSNPVSIMVIRASAVMLLILAGLSAVTGAKTAILLMKICPFVKLACAMLLISGAVSQMDQFPQGNLAKNIIFPDRKEHTA